MSGWLPWRELRQEAEKDAIRGVLEEGLGRGLGWPCPSHPTACPTCGSSRKEIKRLPPRAASLPCHPSRPAASLGRAMISLRSPDSLQPCPPRALRMAGVPSVLGPGSALTTRKGPAASDSLPHALEMQGWCRRDSDRVRTSTLVALGCSEPLGAAALSVSVSATFSSLDSVCSLLINILLGWEWEVRAALRHLS